MRAQAKAAGRTDLYGWGGADAVARKAQLAILEFIVTTEVDTLRGMLCVAPGVSPKESVEDTVEA